MNLTKFNHPQFGELTTVTVNDEPWFIGKEVAAKLGYSNISDALTKHCKKAVIAKHDNSRQAGKIIPESDLYRLIIKSKLPAAEQFEEWVMEDVLPSIRKHGAYFAGQETLSPEELALQGMKALQSIVDNQRLALAAATKTDEVKTKGNTKYTPTALAKVVTGNSPEHRWFDAKHCNEALVIAGFQTREKHPSQNANNYFLTETGRKYGVEFTSGESHYIHWIEDVTRSSEFLKAGKELQSLF